MGPVKEVIEVGIAAVHPDAKNVNTHSPEQIQQIVASIRDFGFNDPIAIDQNGIIVEGHGRYIAAKQLGMEKVPCIRLQFKSEQERLAYAIAHNRTQQLSALDEKVVLNEFDRIGVERDQYEATGYTEDEVVFMHLRQEADEGTGGGTDNGGAKFAIGKAIASTIKFETQDQLFTWLTGMDFLRERYPEEVTLADRIQRFMDEFGGAL